MSRSRYRELMDPIIEMRHGFLPQDGERGRVHVSDLDPSKVRSVQLDPERRYIYSTQVRPIARDD